MIVFRDSFSQHAVAATARKFEYVRNQLSGWMMANSFPTHCITSSTERDSIPPEQWQWETIIHPEQPILTKIELFVERSYLHCPTSGIAQEIAFCWYHCSCDRYGVPTGDWKVGFGVRNGILFNHGTIEHSHWSIHT